jgi:copper chaperone CopZ
MKKTILLSMLFLAGISFTTMAQNIKKEKFKVYGNCGMCESRIEAAAKSIDGVSTADWDKDTKMIAISYDESKTDVHKIHMAIAKVGHDTDMHRASDEVYNSLPGCCHYDRTPSIKESDINSHDHSKGKGHDHGQGHDHSGCTKPESGTSSSCCSKKQG